MDEYSEFLASKRLMAPSSGIEVSPDEINPMLFPFQADLTRWALRKGRAAVFADTGLGKTPISLEWAAKTGERTLIIAPLSVARQTVRIGAQFGYQVHYTRAGDDLTDGINITNYELADRFNASAFGAVVLDESAILRSFHGAYRKQLTVMFSKTSYRLCCTATPAPNDYVELGNHAEFLGISTEPEMRALFFINANKERVVTVGENAYRIKGSNKGGQEWRLKHSAEQPFFRWLASWGMMLKLPSDLGYSDDGYILPPLEVKPIFVEAKGAPHGQLLFTHLHGIADRTAIRRQTLPERLAALAELVKQDSEQWIVWVGLDEESRAVKAALPEAIEVKGGDSPEYKAEAFEAFQDGKHRLLLTKCKIGAYGLNFQMAHKMAFLGMNDSWSDYYQAIRREWRFGQKHPVTVYAILSDYEAEIWQNIQRKEAQAIRLQRELVRHIRGYEEEELGRQTERNDYEGRAVISLPDWLTGTNEDHIHLSSMRQDHHKEAKSGHNEGAAEVLQPEVPRHSEARNGYGGDTEYHLPLPPVWRNSSDVSEPIRTTAECTDVLQPEVLRGGTEGDRQSGVERWATLPKWLRGDLLARPSTC